MENSDQDLNQKNPSPTNDLNSPNFYSQPPVDPNFAQSVPEQTSSDSQPDQSLSTQPIVNQPSEQPDFIQNANQTAPTGAMPSANFSNGLNGPLPAELNGWNWGAFLMSWIWAIGNNTWIGLLALIGPVSLIMSIILGIKGNEWAWKNRKFESVEQFKKTQHVWAVWGVCLFIFSILLVLGLTVGAGILSQQSKRSSVSTNTTSNTPATTPSSQNPPSTNTTSNLLEATPYVNAVEKFSLNTPKGWQKSAENTTDISAEFISPEKDLQNGYTFQPNINVITETGLENITFDSYVTEAKNQVKNALTDYKLLDDKASGSGYLFGGTFSQNQQILRNLQYVMMKDGKAYIVTATALASSWDKYQQTFEQSLLSLKLN